MQLNDTTPEKYPRPSVTVDIIIITIRNGALSILLVKRGLDPYKEMWALPGGFVHIDESLQEAAKRELAEEAGVTDVYLEQLYTFGDVDRDPRGRVITVAYMALLPNPDVTLTAATDTTDAQWHPVNELPAVAFDHEKIISYALNRLKAKIEYSSVAYSLLPDSFRLSELQRVYEIILAHEVDKRNFRKKILSLGLLLPTGESVQDGPHRPAALFRFKKRELVIFD